LPLGAHGPRGRWRSPMWMTTSANWSTWARRQSRSCRTSTCRRSSRASKSVCQSTASTRVRTTCVLLGWTDATVCFFFSRTCNDCLAVVMLLCLLLALHDLDLWHPVYVLQLHRISGFSTRWSRKETMVWKAAVSTCGIDAVCGVESVNVTLKRQEGGN
jgi:hypothetical protein